MNTTNNQKPKMEENKKLLYEFLTLNGCFFSYIDQVGSLDKVVQTCSPLQYLSHFSWDRMKEGGNYWMNMYKRWGAFYKYRNGNK